MGLSVSYGRVTQVESNIAPSMCKQFETDGVVCPSNLRKGLFTASAMETLTIIRHPPQQNHPFMVLASVSYNSLHLILMVIVEI